ncbi:MAG: HAMP domain-containing protein [bacterium]
MDKKPYRIGIQTLYMALLLPLLGVLTVVMAVVIHNDLYRRIEDGFNRKLEAISLAAGAFLDGDQQEDLLRPRVLTGLTYVTSRDALFAIDRDQKDLVRIDPDDGGPHRIGPTGADGPLALAYDPVRDVLYGLEPAGGRLMTLNPDTGEARPAGPAVAAGSGLVFHAREGALYASGAKWLRFNPKTQTWLPVGPMEGETITGLAYDPVRDRILALDNQGKRLLSVDSKSGRVKVIGGLSFTDAGQSIRESLRQAYSNPADLEEDLRRIEEYDRLRETGKPEETAAAWHRIRKIAGYTVAELDTRAEEEGERPLPQASATDFQGLAWDSRQQRLFTCAARLIRVDPESGSCWETGWWDHFRNEISQPYLETILPMRRIWKKLNITYLCTFRRPAEGSWDDEVYVLDVDYGSKHVAIGYRESFQEGEGALIYNKVNTGGVYTSGITNWGEWGLLKSGYAPIYNSANQVWGVVGTDIDVSILATKTRMVLLKTIGIGLFAFLLAGLIAYGITLALLKPIQQLIDKTLIVAAGRYGECAPPQGPTEFRRLCLAFNQMSQSLQTYFQEKIQANQRLQALSARRKLESRLQEEIGQESGPGVLEYTATSFCGADHFHNLSGFVSLPGAFLAWAGFHDGNSLEALKIHWITTLAARALLRRHGPHWETIAPRLRDFYPEAIAWFLLMDTGTGRTHSLQRRPAHYFFWDREFLRHWPEWENQPRILEPGQFLILSSISPGRWQGIAPGLFTAPDLDSAGLRNSIREFFQRNLPSGEFENLTVTVIQRSGS